MIQKFFPLLIALPLFVAACSAPPPTPPPPTRVPATPISTELPPVATSIPAGFNQDNPIQIAWVPDVAVTDPQALADELTEQLQARTDLAVNVLLVESPAQALGLVCGSNQGGVTGAWLDALSFIAAESRSCGVATLRLQRGSADEPDDGEAGVLLVSRSLSTQELDEDDVAAGVLPEIEDLAVLSESTFCRVSIDDFYSWTVPVMLLNANGVDVQSLGDVDELADDDALVAAVADGTCGAIGLPQAVWESYVADDEALEESIQLFDTSAQFPHRVMVFPAAASLEAIDEITDALLILDVAYGRSEFEPEPDATEEPEIEIIGEPEVLDNIFGTGRLIRVESGDFTDLFEFLGETGLNFTLLGD